ncbi:MAG: thioredoxin family protein [Akkermansia sp.]
MYCAGIQRFRHFHGSKRSHGQGSRSQGRQGGESEIRWGKSLKSAQKQAAETGLPIVLLFTGTSWCGFCVKLEKEILSKRGFQTRHGRRGHWRQFEFGSSDFSKSKEAKTYNITGVPAMVVVDADGKELGRTGYVPGRTPAQYVEFSRNTHPRQRKASKAGVPERNLINRSGGRKSGALFCSGKRGWKFVRWTALRPLSYKSYDKAY